MKKAMMITILLAMLFLTAIPVLAGPDIKIDAQVRARTQMDDRSFKTEDSLGGAIDNFRELRTRVGIMGTVKDNAHIYIQFQDSRVAGAAPGTSGGLSGTNGVDLHQGYIKLDNIFGEGWGGMAGRFEFVKGNHRFFGNVGWHQMGRSWDGAALWYSNEDFNVTGFGLNVLELRDKTFDSDFNAYGLYGTINSLNLDLFTLFEVNSDTSGYQPDIKPLSRMNLGMYYHRNHEQFDFAMNGVYQMGTMVGDKVEYYTIDVLDSVVASEVDIAAFLFTFEGGYTLEGDLNARAAVGIDYSSGTDAGDTSSTDYKTYSNSYYTGHKFQGYMDYFLPSTMKGKAYEHAGLMDIMFRAKLDPIPGWTLKGDFHYFTTAADYISAYDDSTLTKDVGMEFDFSVSTVRVAGVNLTAGASVFLPKDHWVGMEDSNMGFWAYTQAIVTLK